jgi:hypothetical protein
MKRFSGRLPAALLILAALALCGAVTAQAQDVAVQHNPIIIHADRQAVSPPLRDIIKNMPPLPLNFHTVPEPRRTRAPIVGSPDGAEQHIQLGKFNSIINLNFAGVGQGDYGYNDYYPVPDTNGAAGDTQYVQFINDDFAVFDKKTGALIAGPTSGTAFWATLGGTCAEAPQGDIVAKYDQIANRWLMLQFEFQEDPYQTCVAVSQTDDATGAYYEYALSFGENFPDYPKISVWPDAYYMTANNFETNGFAAEVCALDRTAMLTGGAMSAQCFLNSDESSFLPSDMDGNGIAEQGEPAFITALYDSSHLHLFKFHVDFSNPSNSTFTGPTTITVATYSPACDENDCIPQPSPGVGLETLSDRLMFRLAYRSFSDHESLLVTHDVTPSNAQAAGLRWYEIRDPNGTPTVFQQGTYSNNKASLWMGSIASDKNGNFALGFSASNSTNLFPSIGVTGRLKSDPAGTMRNPLVIKKGSGVEEYYRWGDYSDMEIDPVDDCTFWYTTEYVKTTIGGGNNWSSQITNFKVPSCK